MNLVVVILADLCKGKKGRIMDMKETVHVSLRGYLLVQKQ